MRQKCNILIIGGGITGLCIAYQLTERKITDSIIIIDKEKDLGVHTSGRNSGILHAGIYYEPTTLKAKICVKGARRLRKWAEDRGLTINGCGKYIVPQEVSLDHKLDLLLERGLMNGANVKIISKDELKERFPSARSASDRALWSPQTCVVNPKEIIKKIKSELEQRGVKILVNSCYSRYVESDCLVETVNGDEISFGHAINCSGAYACDVATTFGIEHDYYVMPFKGEYWQLKKNSSIKVPSNLYPVPDLNVPFLGVHFSPSASTTNPAVSIGPTATLALGRENYHGLEKIEPIELSRCIATLGKQYLVNSGGFRGYIHKQAFQGIQPIFLNEAKKLIPALEADDIEKSRKVGIRPQLFNKSKSKLENDFVCLKRPNSTHILNAISPAFTSSFELADYIIESINNENIAK